LLKTITREFEEMKTHGPLATTIALWFTMLSPFLGPIIAFLGAWFFSAVTG
jgi:hypothetical protein